MWPNSSVCSLHCNPSPCFWFASGSRKILSLLLEEIPIKVISMQKNQNQQRDSEQQRTWTLISGMNKGIAALNSVNSESSDVPIILTDPQAKILVNIMLRTTSWMALSFIHKSFVLLHFMFYIGSVWVYLICCPQKALPRSCSPVMSLTNQRHAVLYVQLRTEKQPSPMLYLAWY